MPPIFRNYDPGKNILIFKGLTIVGFASGTMIKVERDEDTFKKEYGGNGDVVRVRSRKRGGKITFSLLSTSPSNDQLSTIAITDEISGLGYGVGQLEDLFGTTLCHSTNAWLIRPANVEIADDHSPREWTLDCDSLDMFVGGSIV